MNINWDEIADDAEYTPAMVLREFMDNTDLIENIVVIARVRKEGTTRLTFHFQASGDSVIALGLVRLCEAELIDRQLTIEQESA